LEINFIGYGINKKLKEANKMQAKDIMTREIITVISTTTVEETAKILSDNKISGLPVVNDSHEVIGIITEGDLVFQQKKVTTPAFIALFDGVLQLGKQRFYDEIKKIAAYKVEDLMTKEVISVQPDTDISDIATLMIEKNINRVPVVDKENKLVGIITRHDIIKHIYNQEGRS
jgi:CBS domain-containing protein